jgi:hypothetical protein
MFNPYPQQLHQVKPGEIQGIHVFLEKKEFFIPTSSWDHLSLPRAYEVGTSCTKPNG